MRLVGKGAIAGTLLAIGGLQWFLCIVVAEGLHPGFTYSELGYWIPYSSSIHYISELGVGPTALLFNSSLFLLGVMLALAAYFLHRDFGLKAFPILLVITSIGAAGVAIFPTNIQPTHGIFQSIALIFGASCAILSYRLQRPPANYASVFLGALSFLAMLIFFPYLGLDAQDPVTYLGLGKGAMERLVIYPLLLWIIGFGFYLIGQSRD